MIGLRARLLPVCVFALFLAECHAQSLPSDLGRIEYYRPPRLTLMIGFIKDPQHKSYTVAEWAKGIGSKFDAHQIVESCKRAGVTQIIWYDKWIDGMVFRPTKTTGYHTERNFLGELAPECRKQGIKLVIYFNTFYDGNPEFEKWACTDQRGKPIPFSPFWPLNLLSMYSPFREKALEQVRELIQDYDVDGLWLDVPSYPSISYDRWSREAFQRQFGKTMEAATPAERRTFGLRSTANWNKEVAAYARKLKPSTSVVTNYFPDPLPDGPFRAVGMGEPVDYFTAELHTMDLQQQRTSVLGQYDKPFEGGTLVTDDWFTPLNAGPMRTSKGSDQILSEASTIFTGGMNLYIAIALAHDGTVDADSMRSLDTAGLWLKAQQAYLANAVDAGDVAILYGTADPADLDWPGARADSPIDPTWLESALRAQGYQSRRLINCAGSMRWDAIPAGTRTVIIPDRVNLTAAEAEKVRRFAAEGGTVLAFRRGGGLGRSGAGTAIDPMFGVAGAGLMDPPDGINLLWKDKQIPLAGQVIHVHPSTAAVSMWGSIFSEGEMPVLTQNHTGQGNAWFVTVPETSLKNQPEITAQILREVIGEPLFKVSDTTGGYLVRVRHQQGRTVVHIIDRLTAKEGPMARYRPLYTQVTLNGARVPFQKATVVPDQRPLKVDSSGIWKTFEVFPNPEITIVLE
jgi:hypothetical protein